MKLIERIRGRKPQPQFSFTGNCPARSRTGDGVSVGRCWHSTYEGVCPIHGNVEAWIALADGERCSIDENDLPPYEKRDFGSAELREFLGVRVPVR